LAKTPKPGVPWSEKAGLWLVDKCSVRRCSIRAPIRRSDSASIHRLGSFFCARCSFLGAKPHGQQFPANRAWTQQDLMQKRFVILVSQEDSIASFLLNRVQENS